MLNFFLSVPTGGEQMKRMVITALIFCALLFQTAILQAAGFLHVFEVGEGKAYPTPADVPWESLQASTLVLIYYRAEPYRNKWVISTTGTAENPVVVRGVPDENGNRPVINGENAVTRRQLDYWNESRSVVKIGGSSHPGEEPAFITVENLEIRSGRPSYTFTNDSGTVETYSSNAAAIHVEAGRNISIRNCILTDSGNGFFAGAGGSDLLLEYNHIHDNGIEGSIYHHNNYTEVDHITFQFNHFGPLRAGCRGNNLKDRSAGTLIRYNLIEGGSRTIDLVESDHEALLTDPDYRETNVYGNVLIKYDVQENGQVLHYGGDSGDYSRYRKGMLLFYNNTVVSHRADKTTLFGISTNDESVSAYNNIVYLTAVTGSLAIMGSEGVVSLVRNWLPEGWRTTHESGINGTLSSADTLTGQTPGFVDSSSDDYHLIADSPCIDTADVTMVANTDRDEVSRPQGGGYEIGAYEFPVQDKSIYIFLPAIIKGSKTSP